MIITKTESNAPYFTSVYQNEINILENADVKLIKGLRKALKSKEVIKLAEENDIFVDSHAKNHLTIGVGEAHNHFIFESASYAKAKDIKEALITKLQSFIKSFD